MTHRDQSDIVREIDTVIDLRPSDLHPPTRVDLHVYQASPGMVAVRLLVNGTHVVMTATGPTVGYALMTAGALMAGIEVLPNVKLRPRPWWRRS